MPDDEANISTETNSDPSAAIKSVALDQMSKSEDIMAYASERADQEREAAGEQPSTPPEQRASRYREALDLARQETSQARQEAGLGPNGQDFDSQVEAAYAQQEAEQARDAELARAEKNGADVATYKMRAAQALNEHPDYWEAVQSTFSVIPPTQEIAQQLLEAEEGPEIVWRLTQNLDALQQLNEMPARAAEKFLDKLNGHIMAEKAIARSFAASPQPRRITNAPPVFKSPSGGASPPSDAFQLAKRGEDATDYVRWRQQQDKRRG
jgi:hypothetical protein